MDTAEYNRKLKLLAAKLEDEQFAHGHASPESFSETREAFEKVKPNLIY
jgi:hypothetical protein